MDDMKIAAARERVSALMDGDDIGAEAVQAVLADSRLVQAWHTYQVVGDVLRSAELAPSRSDLAFLGRLEQRLAQESLRTVSLGGDVANPVAASGKPAANTAVFGWKILASAACVALVGVVAMQLGVTVGGRVDGQMAATQPVVAPSPNMVVADSAAGSMLRDPRLDELMAAHRQLGGHSALQVPAGFLRNATYEGTGR